MELRHLRYFQAVAEELNFSRAAKRLRVAQPALSRAVKQLEHALGAQVLERTRHRVRLTPAGAVLLRDTGHLLEQVEDVARRVRRTADNLDLHIRNSHKAFCPEPENYLPPVNFVRNKNYGKQPQRIKPEC